MRASRRLSPEQDRDDDMLFSTASIESTPFPPTAARLRVIPQRRVRYFLNDVLNGPYDL